MKSILAFQMALSLLVVLALTACGSSNPDLSGKPIAVGSKENHGEKVEALEDPKIDILFVVDNSGSMKPYQDKMAKNVELFANEFFHNTHINYRIGVVPIYDSKYLNDKTVYTPSGPRKMNPLGELVALKGAEASNGAAPQLYITRATPNPTEVLKQTVVIGIQWGPEAEESFSPVLAVTDETINQQKNQGFYEKDAYLAVIFLTDADDVTLGLSGDDFYQRLKALKGGDGSKILIAAAIPKSCAPTDGQGPIKSIPDVVNASMGITADLCADSFGGKLGKFGRHLVQRMTERKVHLDFEPDISTLIVTHAPPNTPKEGRTPIAENAYRYDPTNRNVVIVDPDLDLPNGHVVYVEANEVNPNKRRNKSL